MNFRLTEYSQRTQEENSQVREIISDLKTLRDLFKKLKLSKYSHLLKLLEELIKKEGELSKIYGQISGLLDQLKKINDELFRISKLKLEAEGEVAFARSLLKMTKSALSIFQGWENSLCEILCTINNQCKINYAHEIFKLFTLPITLSSNSMGKCLISKLISANNLKSTIVNHSQPSSNGINGGGSEQAKQDLNKIEESFKGVLDKSNSVVWSLYLYLWKVYSALGLSYLKTGIWGTKLKLTSLEEYLKKWEISDLQSKGKNILKIIGKKQRDAFNTFSKYSQLRKNISSIQRYYGGFQTWLSQRQFRLKYD